MCVLAIVLPLLERSPVREAKQGRLASRERPIDVVVERGGPVVAVSCKRRTRGEQDIAAEIEPVRKVRPLRVPSGVAAHDRRPAGLLPRKCHDVILCPVVGPAVKVDAGIADVMEHVARQVGVGHLLIRVKTLRPIVKMCSPVHEILIDLRGNRTVIRLRIVAGVIV